MRLNKKLTNKREDKTKETTCIGISGWLFLPAVSMVTTPFLLISLILTNLKIMNNSVFNDIFIEYPGLRASIVSQTLIAYMQLILVTYVSLLFFRKKQELPKMFIAFFTVNLLIMIANASWIFSVFKKLRYPEYIGVIVAIFMTAIGIPYFMKSKRVKATFVNL
jgi:hypothetical protein